MTDPETPETPGIDTSKPKPQQQIQALQIAAGLGVLEYRWPVDLDDASVVASHGHMYPTLTLPDRGGLHYLVILDGRPALLAAPETLIAVFMWVLARLGPDAARQVEFRPGLLPH
jgi:hypothetical protein